MFAIVINIPDLSNLQIDPCACNDLSQKAGAPANALPLTLEMTTLSPGNTTQLSGTQL